MKISLVVPVFNEEDAIPFFYKEVRTDKQLSLHEIELIFVDDGSSDRTCSIVEALTVSDQLVTLVRLSRNFGKEAALDRKSVV